MIKTKEKCLVCGDMHGLNHSCNEFLTVDFEPKKPKNPEIEALRLTVLSQRETIKALEKSVSNLAKLIQQDGQVKVTGDTGVIEKVELSTYREHL